MTLLDYLRILKEKLDKLFNTLSLTDVVSKENDDSFEDGVKQELKQAVYETENYIRFPDNVFEPEDVLIDNEVYKLYMARFGNLYDLYEYLKSNPKINKDIFYRLHSIIGSSNFAGKPYEEALEDLISDIDSGYDEFLKLQSDINNAKNVEIHKYRMTRTVAGGHLNVPAYSMGNPLCYETEEKIKKPRFLTIHVALSYYWGTTKSQVLHRAIIITNILKALESAGYNVDLKAFELSDNCNELVYIVVDIKKYGGKLNMQALYKTLCHVEFLRRILFRVLETMNVKNDWEDGYGSTCTEGFARKLLKCDNNDIFFDQPRAMGINGEDLADDFENAINHLNLQDKIDVEKAKREFSNEAKILKLKK